jgi:hypothetical protein
MKAEGRKAYFTFQLDSYLWYAANYNLPIYLFIGNRFDRIILPRADKIAENLIIELLDRSDEFRDLGIKSSDFLDDTCV